MQYADVAEWQQELLSSEESKAGRDYWRDYCKNIDCSALNTAVGGFQKNGSCVFTPEAVRLQIELTPLGANALSSLPEFLLASWGAFLSRMTGRPSVTVGCYFDGRSYAELASALGVFAKSLPLNSNCADGVTFQSLLDQTRRDYSEFRNWQDSFAWADAGMTAGAGTGSAIRV